MVFSYLYHVLGVLCSMYGRVAVADIFVCGQARVCAPIGSSESLRADPEYEHDGSPLLQRQRASYILSFILMHE